MDDNVYELTSGYVHLSERHISAALDATDELGPHVALGTMDRREPRHFHEPARCMVRLALIINHARGGWLDRMCDDDAYIGALKAPLRLMDGEPPAATLSEA